VSGDPGHTSSQGAAFYAQDFVSDIGVRVICRPCHSTKHRRGYIKHGHGYTKRAYNEYLARHNEHAARNDINPNRNNFNHRVQLNGHIANHSAWKHHRRQPCNNSGNAGRSGQRGISNWRDTRFHYDGNIDHRGPVHSVQQHWNFNDCERYAYHRKYFRYRE
jgi:hypothetical protein